MTPYMYIGFACYSVADRGSGAFLTPGSWNLGEFIPDPGSQTHISYVKFMGTKKVGQKNCPYPLFVSVGSCGSGMEEKQDPG